MALLLVITFMSNTLIDMHVPRVEVAFPQQGIIRPEAISSGIVRPAVHEHVFTPVSGRITQILEPGDTINSNTVLFTITNDVSAFYDMLADAEHQRDVITLNRQRTQADQQYEQQRLELLLSSTVIPPAPPILNLWNYDLQLEANANELTQIEADINALQILYEEGMISRQDIATKEDELERLAQQRVQLNRQRELAVANHEAAMTAHQGNLTNQAQIRESQIQDQRNRITQLDFTLATQNLELERINDRIYTLLLHLSNDGTVEVQLAEDTFADRTVASLMPGIGVGMVVQEGMPIMHTALNDNHFVVEATFPLTQDFIEIGQRAELTIGNVTAEGEVTNIQPDGGRNVVTINISSENISGGELAQVTVSGPSSTHTNIIPINALRQDVYGYFILFVESVDRFIGSNYHTYMHRVEMVARSNTRVAIQSAFVPGLPGDAIVINSDMPVHAAERVRLVGGH